MFVDRVEIEVTGGKGGDGCMSFRKEKFVPRGGPDGGDGGGGGSVILVARDGVNNLNDFAGRKFWKAERGSHGSGAKRTGRHGADMVLYVPPGTTIIDAEHGFVIKDMIDIDDTVVVARGGKAGKGNTSFKSATNQAPRERTVGELGEVRNLILELKSIADVGLIGMPNAGKSTLLSRLSQARPEIANYPFTTKHPNLGQVKVDRDRSFILADIPGLIEGAHEGVGLGHEFLRHVERAGILVHLVEPEPSDGTDPVENYRSIRHELTEYTSQLSERPEIVAVTKCELPAADEVCQRMAEVVDQRVHRISAMTGEGLKDLLEAVSAELLKRHQLPTASSNMVAPEEPKPKRVPPHLAGPTSKLSNEVQAHDYVHEEESP
ncbi:GTPase Obg [Rosistilla oblonga]|uniref:GTPase Obg n=1 Tax=Rosistilla oblonga TaxID=2527990 RepID=A0A518IS69_9BACT|nr:GTPase ObgE [Rosistilla oblonga]QDV11975.1 GTPase Obg [Rosistilla oblonga]QDV55924.1 GTPase Obg [Rosistilla oblonga]